MNGSNAQPDGDMTTNSAPNEAFDRTVREHHLRALGSVSAATLVRLRDGRRTTIEPRRHRLAWWATAGSAAALALVVITQLQPTGSPMDADSTDQVAQRAPVDPAIPDIAAAMDDDTALAMLEEDPDLYLWLAVNDDVLLATAE